ncbi:MAG: N-acetylmuramoyl-L-alanine amidase, partial [Oscillospiraceae bacterium]
GCSLIFNAGLFDTKTFASCCDVRADGRWLSDDCWGYFGYGWSGTETPRVLHSSLGGSVDNYISCLWAIHEGEKQPLNDNDPALGGVRGRTAFGFRADGEMIILCTADGMGALKLTGARDLLFGEGCVNGIILDGGGSPQIICPEGRIFSNRIVRTFICVWLEKEDKPLNDRKFKVFLDPGHGTNEPNCSPDRKYFEYKFTFDLALKVKELLESTERFEVKLSKTSAEESLGLSARAAAANAWGADIFVSEHSNAVGAGAWVDGTHGLTVWIYAPGGKRELLARRLLDEYAEMGIELFGAKLYTSKFTVLAKSNMPAVLVENYFHTCRADVAKLLDAGEFDKLAYAQARGICEYFNMADDSIPLPEPEKEVEVLKDILYRVQLGAFADENNAKQMAEMLEKAGYQTIIKEEKRK